MAKEQILGPFEEAVLAAILGLRGEAYGVPIQKAVAESEGRDVTFSAIYTTLDRLEAKGFVSSRTGDPTPQRGGRAKKFFKIEAPGQHALNAARERAMRRFGGSPLGAST